MGLRKEYIEWMLEMLALSGYGSFKGLRMCELGNQEIKESASDYFYEKGMKRFKTGKEYFTYLGFYHTSIDINGKDGALPIDLTKPIVDGNLTGLFDVITNFGTTEHVRNQFECLKNLHSLCKVDGIFLHLVPPTGYEKVRTARHYYVSDRNQHEYHPHFFNRLAARCSYNILDTRTIRDLICVAMRKTVDNRFISEEQFEPLCAT